MLSVKDWWLPSLDTWLKVMTGFSRDPSASSSAVSVCLSTSVCTWRPSDTDFFTVLALNVLTLCLHSSGWSELDEEDMTEDVTLVVCFTLDLVVEAAAERFRLGEDRATTPVGVPGVEGAPEGVSITSIPMRSSKSIELDEKDCLMICFLLLLKDCCTQDDVDDEVVDDLDETLVVAGATVAAVVVSQVDSLGGLEGAGLLHVVVVAEAEPALAVIERALVDVHLLLVTLAARLTLAQPTRLFVLAWCLQLLLLLLVAADHRRQVFHVALVQEVERVLQVVHRGGGRRGLGAAANDAVVLDDARAALGQQPLDGRRGLLGRAEHAGGRVVRGELLSGGGHAHGAHDERGARAGGGCARAGGRAPLVHHLVGGLLLLLAAPQLGALPAAEGVLLSARAGLRVGAEPAGDVDALLTVQVDPQLQLQRAEGLGVGGRRAVLRRVAFQTNDWAPPDRMTGQWEVEARKDDRGGEKQKEKFLRKRRSLIWSEGPLGGGWILPQDPRGRRLLVCTGGLRRLQEIPAEPGSAIAESVAVINCCFPEEIVRCAIILELFPLRLAHLQSSSDSA
ncbi:Sperm-associated antigen 6 [Frankliniella fusca]|uniref:Sperm-associated antigen 6 n=1 Tax=Frankliniella fusca TaxID=407009 RepID=A0AAE1H5I6_9NEOP|nr:Sperm-associated antigen 6 [Frankliniella fusca]